MRIDEQARRSEFNRPEAAALEKLKSVLGDKGWRSAAQAPRYFEDPRGRFQGNAGLILLPASTDEVASIIRLCNAEKLGIIPYGGGTGVVAGQLSPDSENAIVLSLERMNTIRSVQHEDMTMVAEAGCILENIHKAALQQGLMFPLNMASKGSCTIGGNLATNAGGIQVLRHGNARDLCLGIEAVLPSGDVLNGLSPLRKDNTGYDLRHLLIGSEGTLGVITAATLVLKPIDPETVTVLCAIASPADALHLFRKLREDIGDGLSALELLSDFGVNLVTRHFPNLANPFSQTASWYLLAEIGGQKGVRARVETALEVGMGKGLLLDAVMASSEAQRQNLWDLREFTPEANRMTGAICSSDTSVPVSQIDRFITRTRAAVLDLDPGLRINSYGHIGDGNIHHNVFPPEGVGKAEFVASRSSMIEAIRQAINEVSAACGGSISAEHGIGRLKIEDLKSHAEPAKMAALRQIKSALDPNNIMNPGALIA